MQVIQKLRKQRGSITLIGIGSIVFSLFAFTQIVEFANAKLLDRELDNYARDVASVALRSELALTVNMADRNTYTNDTVDALLSQVGMSVYDSNDPEQSGNIEKKITFGNIISGEFVAITKGDPSNPKGSMDSTIESVIDFSAVAVQLWSTEKSFYSYTPQGKAIYGLPEASTKSTDIADCFCDKRYELCLVSDMAGVTGTFLGHVGAVGTADRQNYCEYGYVESHPDTTIPKTKYQSVELSSQWLAKAIFDNNGTIETLIDMTDGGQQRTNYDIVSNQEPLEVFDGVNPFPTKTWSFWNLNWFNSGGDYYVRDWYGSVVKASGLSSSPYISGYKSEYSIDPGGMFSSDKVFVDGYFYVGRTGVCVDGTVAADVPKISGGLDDLSAGAKDKTDPEVQRCLSYYKDPLGSISTTTIENQCTTTCDGIIMPFVGCMGTETTTCGDVPVTTLTPYSGFGQQSCRDFNSNVETRMNFFQWMMSLFFGPITSVDTSYEQLDCSVKKMKQFNVSIFNWLPF